MQPKFAMGQSVHCFREDNEAWHGFDFTGQVLHIADTGEAPVASDFEYRVSNAPEVAPGFPLLIWESEMTAV